MKKGSWIAILSVLLVMITSCSMLTPAVRPAGCENSVIYDKVGNPAVVGTLIKLANFKAIKKNVYRKKEAVSAIKSLKTLLVKEPLTFNEFLGVVDSAAGKYLKEYGEELLLVDMAFSNLQVDLPINKCDKGLITSLCDQMLAQLE